MRVQFLASGFGTDFQEKFEKIFAIQPERAGAIRRRYRESFAQPVRRWSILSPNYRTIGIFLCALLKASLCYFFFEVASLSLILADLVAVQRAPGCYQCMWRKR